MSAAIKPIRTDTDYQLALKRIDELMDADVGTNAFDELEVLSTLVEIYEDKHFPIDLPSPLAAIQFRMEQEGLSNRDLIPLIGSRAKVSEVLAGKRSLTLKMIRALHEHLKIPADVLLQDAGASLPNSPENIDWSKFPISTMVKMGWIGSEWNIKDQAEEIMRHLIDKAGGFEALPGALFRKNNFNLQNAKMDTYALKAWCYKLLATALDNPIKVKYKKNSIDANFVSNLAELSCSDKGPKLAKEYLEMHGIQMIALKHLPRTYLDGAVLTLRDGTPIIGLTLRYDRIDNFWFCLFHELAHIALHLDQNIKDLFIDDLSLINTQDLKPENIEYQADKWAQEALIPTPIWMNNDVRLHPTLKAVNEFAFKQRIHPAIVAGRIRRERNNYHLLTRCVGGREVRKHFWRSDD